MYCTITEILKDIDEDILVQLVDDENRGSDVVDLTDDEDVATVRALQAITDADNEIDDYLRAKYALPLSETPGTVNLLSKDISIYNLYKRRHRLNMPESIVDIYDKAIKKLDKIQKGLIILDVAQLSSGTEAGSGEIRVNKTSDDKTFNDDLLDMY